MASSFPFEGAEFVRSAPILWVHNLVHEAGRRPLQRHNNLA